MRWTSNPYPSSYSFTHTAHLCGWFAFALKICIHRLYIIDHFSSRNYGLFLTTIASEQMLSFPFLLCISFPLHSQLSVVRLSEYSRNASKFVNFIYGVVIIHIHLGVCMNSVVRFEPSAVVTLPEITLVAHSYIITCPLSVHLLWSRLLHIYFHACVSTRDKRHLRFFSISLSSFPLTWRVHKDLVVRISEHFNLIKAYSLPLFLCCRSHICVSVSQGQGWTVLGHDVALDDAQFDLEQLWVHIHTYILSLPLTLATCDSSGGLVDHVNITLAF